jgi:hypothetical protein
MPSHATIVLGPLTLKVKWPITRTPPVRQVGVSSNALAEEPVQVTDYISDYGVLAMTVVLRGVETLGESAGAHLDRQQSNLEAVIASDTSTFSLLRGGSVDPWTCRVFKSDPPVVVDDFYSDRQAYRAVDVTLRYLDS